MITKAIQFATQRHQGQLDDEGKPYILHLETVGLLLSHVTDDDEVICAGILHDILEDTDTTYEELGAEFGSRVANLVREVTKEGKKDEKGYYFPRLHSEGGFLIKFADRLSNLARMKGWDEKRKQQYLRKSKFWKTKV